LVSSAVSTVLGWGSAGFGSAGLDDSIAGAASLIASLRSSRLKYYFEMSE